MSVNWSSSFFLFHAQTHRHLPFPDSVFNDRDHLYLLQRLFIACHIDAALNLTERHGPQPIHIEEDKVVSRRRWKISCSAGVYAGDSVPDSA